MSSVTAIILVGGPTKGTRFRPLSLDLPKPLFPIAGRPMIYHHIEACISQLKELNEIILLGFYKESQFTDFVNETSAALKIKIRYLNEIGILGTAGGLFHFRKEILCGSPANILILHSDICCTFPVADLLNFHRAHQRPCTIMGTKVPKEHANYFGCLVKDEQSNALLHYVEKPETFVSDLINAGMYCFDPSFLDEIGAVMGERVLKAKKEESGLPQEYAEEAVHPEKMQLEQHIFAPLAGSGRVMVFGYNGFWRQIKNAGASVYCNDLYTKYFARVKPEILTPPSASISGNVIVHPSAIIDPTAKIGPNVTIGANVKIGKGVRILHSIILEGAEIKDHACIMYTILGWGSSVGIWARVEGIPNYSPFLYARDKRQGITIFGAGAVAAREIIVRNCIVMPQKTLSQNYFNKILL
eukprot:TRINITY_DN340_c1_g1_i11.p1 TRINITY_DN340_c1_g1~~TRINITY_DN340_c1_g1_i11.p1  ORF type:complete len:414 (+),score=62.20 TRINITY_DN340_c1_g1_i11:213-1454(+)